MGTTNDRSAETEGGEPVKTAAPPGAESRFKYGGTVKNHSGAVRGISLVEAYDRWASTYDAPNPLHALEERVMGLLLPSVAGKRVLDVACGTGRWLEKLLGWGARSAWGVDLSAGMLRHASAKPSLHGRVVRGNYLALPFAAASADLIICSLAAGHVRNIGELARELARVAAHGADVFVTDFHPLAYARGWRRTFHDGTEAVEVPSRAHTVERVRYVFEEEGFRVTMSVEPRMGGPERGIFTQRGKAHLFEAACESPALYILRFQRAGVADPRGHRN